MKTLELQPAPAPERNIHGSQQVKNCGIFDMGVGHPRWVRWDMPGDFTEYYDVYSEAERYTGYDGTISSSDSVSFILPSACSYNKDVTRTQYGVL
jgi:hypothetical protein